MRRDKYDVVLVGATGFTGGLIVEYFARNVPLGEVRWALAGRDQTKLEGRREEAAALQEACADLDLLVVDLHDDDAMKRLAEGTRVVLTTVGPYALHGEGLVRACAQAGTDYLDLTGEDDFVRDMRERYSDAAERSGALLIHACGLDSMPADLGTLFAVRQLPADARKSVRAYCLFDARFSGGTWSTMVHGMSRGAARRLMRTTQAQPSEGRSEAPMPGVHRSPSSGRWVLPMPVIDRAIVRWSSLARPADYGEAFRYAQYFELASPVQAAMLGGVLGGAALLAQIPAGRRWLIGRRPPGTGPSAERRARSWFRFTFEAEAGQHRVVTRVSGGDPGYTETSKMISEAALTLVRHREELPVQAGFTTPAAALGDLLLERLPQIGIEFTVAE
jgi:saccharopine dehydrogenase (NAD+, L-glutamate forming)